MPKTTHYFDPRGAGRNSTVKGYAVDLQEAEYYMVFNVAYLSGQDPYEGYSYTRAVRLDQLGANLTDAQKTLLRNALVKGRFDPFYPLNLPLFYTLNTYSSRFNNAPLFRIKQPSPRYERAGIGFFASAEYAPSGHTFISPNDNFDYMSAVTAMPLPNGAMSTDNTLNAWPGMSTAPNYDIPSFSLRYALRINESITLAPTGSQASTLIAYSRAFGSYLAQHAGDNFGGAEFEGEKALFNWSRIPDGPSQINLPQRFLVEIEHKAEGTWQFALQAYWPPYQNFGPKRMDVRLGVGTLPIGAGLKFFYEYDSLFEQYRVKVHDYSGLVNSNPDLQGLANWLAAIFHNHVNHWRNSDSHTTLYGLITGYIVAAVPLRDYTDFFSPRTFTSFAGLHVPPDLRLTLDQSSVRIGRGQAASVQGEVTRLNDLKGPISLSYSAPSGISVTGPSSIAENASHIFQMQIQVADSVPEGTYSVTITASGDGAQRSAQLSVQVTRVEAPVGSYSLDLQPAAVRLPAGGTTEVMVNIARNSFPAPVNISLLGNAPLSQTAASDRLAWRTETLSPNLVKLVLTAGASLPNNTTYQLTVLGTSPGHTDRSAVLSVTIGDRVVGDGNARGPQADSTPIRTDTLYLYGEGGDFYQEGWDAPDLPYRVAVGSNFVTKHPWIPANPNLVRAFTFGGQEVSVRFMGDAMALSGTPPFWVYFMPDRNASSPLAYPNVEANWSMVQDRAPMAGYEGNDGLWLVYLGGYGESDPVLAAERRDAASPYEATDYVTRITDSSIELVVPESVSQMVMTNTVYPIYVGYEDRKTGRQYPVMYRYATSTSIEPGAGNLRVNIQLVRQDEFFNVDVSALSREGVLPTGIVSEESWVKWLFRISGMHGLLTKEQGVMFKSLSYWIAPPPSGPGLPADEFWSRILNGTLGTTMGEIETLLQANLCTYVPRPDGGVHIVPMVPYYNKTAADFVNGSVPVLFYNAKKSGSRFVYQRDPKLDVSDISLSFDLQYAIVEVEGYSNTVQGNLVKSYATWVQGGRETKVLQIDAGLWENDAYRFQQMWESMKTSKGNYDDPEDIVHGQLQANQPGFRFSKLDRGVPKRRYYPEVWYRLVGMRSDDPNNLEYTTGDPNYGIHLEGWQYGYFTDAAANAYGVLQDFERLPADQKNFNPKLALLGFRAYGYAKNVCGSVFGDPFYTIKVKAPDLDSATLQIIPLVGKPKDKFAPKWFPSFYSRYVQPNLNAYPRKVKRIQNPYISEMGSPTYSVQSQGYESAYTEASSLADHVSTWLTFMEFLKTRRARVRYAGFAPWRKYQVVGIAVAPESGDGALVKYMDFFMLDQPSVRVDMGGTAWTETEAYFMFRINLQDNSVSYDVPIRFTSEDGLAWVADSWPEGGIGIL